MIPTDRLVAYALFAFAACWSYVFLSGLIWGAGWGPTSRKQLEAAAHLLDLKEGDTVYDLGSGFGRAVLFFAAEKRADAVGVEIDPLRARVTRWSAERRGLSGRVRVVRANLLDVDLSQARKVFLFLTPIIMRKAEEKLVKELPPGAMVVSVEHRFPDWRPVDSLANVHLYLVGARTKVPLVVPASEDQKS